MSDFDILQTNALLYTFTLVFVIITKKRISIGLILLGLFTFSSWMSVLLLNQSFFEHSIHNNHQHLDALLYLYAIVMICLSPLFRVSRAVENGICFSNIRFLYYLIICVGSFQLLRFIIELPLIYNIVTMNDYFLSDMRENVYVGSNSIFFKIPLLNRLYHLYSGIQPLSLGLSVVLFLTYKRNRKLIIFFMLTNLLAVVTNSIVDVSRGVIVETAIFIFLILFYLRDYINARVKIFFIVVVLPSSIITAIFFWTVTISRFGEMAEYMMYKYPGEAMVNFSGILYHDLRNTTDGTAYLFSAFVRKFVSTEEKWQYIEKITHCPANIFYTFVGGLYMEFGKYITIIIALIINLIERHLINNRCNSFIIPLIFIIYFYSRGIFLFPLQSFLGVGLIFYTILLYYVFKSSNSTCKVQI